MKLFCVLLSFICSVHVSADLNLYRREVFITNKHIKAASKNNHDLHGNSLERVIKHIVFANNYGYGYEYNMYALSLMIAVPEHIDLADIFFYIHFQRCIRSVIRLKTSVPVPDVQNQTSGNLNLPQLGKDRRRTTRKALRQIIINVLDGTEPPVSKDKMCRLLGLWTSTEIPSFYIKVAYIEPYQSGVCNLKDKYDHVIKYRPFDDVYWQVDDNNIELKIVELKEQLFDEDIAVITVR